MAETYLVLCLLKTIYANGVFLQILQTFSDLLFCRAPAHQASTCSMPMIETLEKVEKYVQS